MKKYFVFAMSLLAGLFFGALTQAALAQSLKEKIVGAWTLAEGSEVFADGKKVIPWIKGSLSISSNGHVLFFVLPKGRSKTDSVRASAGPMVCTVRHLHRG